MLRHRVYKKTSQDNTDSLIDDLKVAKADSVKMSIERNLILAHFWEHICTLQTPANANVEWKMTLTDVMTKIPELFESVRLTDRSDYSVKMLKPAWEAQ